MVKSVFINGCMITKAPTGITVHNINIIKQLLPKLQESNIEFKIYVYEKKLISEFVEESYLEFISLGKTLDFLFLRYKSFHRILWNIFLLNYLSKNYDVIYSPVSYGSLNNKKQIITVHDLISQVYPSQHVPQFLYFKLLVPILLKNCGKIIGISKFTISEIKKFYPGISGSKIKLIYNGVDHIKDNSDERSDEFVKTLTQNKPFYISVGCSYPHKNAEKIFDIASGCRKDIKFVITGKESLYFKTLRTLANKRKLDNIIFLNYVTDDVLSSLYKLAHGNLYFSIYEGFGFPPAEASYFKTCTLIAENKGIREIYCDNFPTNSSSFFSSESKILKHDSFYNSLSFKYNWAKAASEVYSLILDFSTN